MKIAKLNKYDVINGEGIRTSVFVSGCSHGCKGCFNLEAQDFSYGQDFTEDLKSQIEMYCQDPNVVGLSILGGEPLHPKNLEMTLWLSLSCPTNKNVWVWSGYTYEELMKRQGEDRILTNAILRSIDVLVDGRFDLSKRDLKLKYRGSSNQRVIDVKESRRKGKIVLYYEED